MKEREALKLALEALESLVESHGYTSYISDEEKEAEGEVMFARSTITAIKEALAQPEQEPVAWRWLSSKTWKQWSLSDDKKLVAEAVEWLGEEKVQPLYTTPPQRKPLTDEQIYQMWTDEGLANSYEIYSLKEHVRRAARAIEAAHGIKE